MLPGVFDGRDVAALREEIDVVFDTVPARAHARGQGRVPLRAVQSQRGVPGGGGPPTRPRGDRTVARRGLPRHRQHRVAQPGRLRGRPVALRRGPAHPAPRGHPLGRPHPVSRVRDRCAHLFAGLRGRRRTDRHRARQPPLRPARPVRPDVRPGPHLRRATAGGRRGRTRAMSRCSSRTSGTAVCRPSRTDGAATSCRCTTVAAISRSACAPPTSRTNSRRKRSSRAKTERARTLVGLHDPFFYDA